MSSKITFVCWLWRGWNPVYDHRHVNRLFHALQKHMRQAFRLVCVTNFPEGIECETFPMWDVPQIETEPGKPNCYARLRLFDPKIGGQFGADALVSIDLDCVIRKDLSPLFAEPTTFRACQGYRSHLNGSMWMLRVGEHADVWRDFDPIESPRLLRRTEVEPGVPISGSDQAWMSLKMPNARLWTDTDGVGQYLQMRPQTRRNPPPHHRIVFFCGRTKPWDPEIRMERSPLYDPLPEAA